MHGHGGQPRPEAAVRQASVEAGDRADAGLRQRGRQRAQVVWTDGHVTVGRDNDRVASDTRHIDEVGDLAVAAMRGGVDDQFNVELGISCNQRSDDRDRAIVRILDAEDELNFARIILMKIRLDVLGQ